MADGSNMFLFWGSGSGPCWKVQLVLAELGVTGYKEKKIEFSKKEHKGEEVTKLNPRGQVPTFKDGDQVVNESTAACMYLQEKYGKPENSLYPKDLAARAKVYQRMMEVSNLQSIILAPIMYYRMMNSDQSTWDTEMLKEKIAKANEELKLWEGYLAESGDYIASKEFSMADVFFYVIIATLDRQGANFETKYPNIHRYLTNLKTRKTIQATTPPHWAESASPGLLKDLCD